VAFAQPFEAFRAAAVKCPLLNGIELGIQFKAIFPRGAKSGPPLWTSGPPHRADYSLD
jgi:hypothetical protein